MPRMPDSHELSEVSSVVKRSRFIAVIAPCSDLDNVKALLAQRKKRYHKARHHCWACRLENEGGQIVEQARDDGEVGRPGMALLEILRNRELRNVVIVVSRLFGGIKLGPGGVARAFRDVGQACVNQYLDRQASAKHPS